MNNSQECSKNICLKNFRSFFNKIKLVTIYLLKLSREELQDTSKRIKLFVTSHSMVNQIIEDIKGPLKNIIVSTLISFLIKASIKLAEHINAQYIQFNLFVNKYTQPLLSLFWMSSSFTPFASLILIIHSSIEITKTQDQRTMKLHFTNTGISTMLLRPSKKGLPHPCQILQTN